MTDPKQLVTKDDLHDFYGQILPYLGGMPQVLANKFSKGDLYDTSEKMIGKYINGKPLYQKTIDFGNLPNATSKAVSTGVTGLEKVVSLECFAYNTDDGWSISLPVCNPNDYTANISINFIDSENKINVLTARDRSNMTAYATIKYTKTTDQANSFNIGEATDYSTDEKIVGTWLSGEPLYQKTTTFTLPSTSGASSQPYSLIPDIPFASMDTLVSMEGWSKRSDSDWLVKLGGYYEGSSSQVNFMIDWNKSTQALYLYIGTLNAGQQATVTFQYTKTN